MHDFGKLVYLDPQKTGSTFVSRFLSETCILRELRNWKHGRLNTRARKGTYYFVTVRHPLAQYSSLFRYGLDGRGGLYERLSQRGMKNLYNHNPGAFNEWLRFIMDYRNAAYLGEGFDQIPERFDLGFMSYRYLMVSLPRPGRTLLVKPEKIELVDYVRTKSVVNRIIYNERLNDGLIELATRVKPEYFDQVKVEKFFRMNTKENAATTTAESIEEVDFDLRALIWRKERVLLSLYS